MNVYETETGDCQQNPGLYKTCGQWKCVPLNITCPCTPDEFSCADDTCIPKSLVCNDVKDCRNGNDEVICKNGESSSIPLSIFIAVITACVLFCAIVIVFAFICIRRRLQKRDGSLTSNVLLQQSNEKDNIHEVCESSSKPCTKVTSNGSESKHNPQRNYGYEKVPQDFGIFFGEEFLGTSTPKQGIKHIIHPKRFSGNVDIKDQMVANQSLNSYSDFKNGVQKSQIQERAIGDSVGDLNTSLFLPIT